MAPRHNRRGRNAAEQPGDGQPVILGPRSALTSFLHVSQLFITCDSPYIKSWFAATRVLNFLIAKAGQPVHIVHTKFKH